MLTPFQAFQARREEAWQKLLEILNDGLNKSDWIEIDEATYEFGKRYIDANIYMLRTTFLEA